jgi:large subunit ribosomal protein L20
MYRQAIEFTRRAGAYSTRDRRQKKRHFRELWVVRLSGALRSRGLPYNRFIHALAVAGIELNRKMLSNLAIVDVAAFDAIVELARPHMAAPKAKAAAA